MVGLNAAGGGAIVGLLIGAALSLYVAILDARKRTAQIRVRAQYRGSLVAVPGLLAGLGALIGAGIAHVL
jgi:hypothetical protein